MIRGRVRLSAALVAAIALVTGCASVGAGTGVESGLEVRGADVQQIREFFPGPEQDATQEQIVLGFIRAGAASDGDYSTAREFLTEDTAKTWRPEGEIVLYSTTTPLTVSARATNLSVLTGSISATIDPDGRYVTAASATVRAVNFEFARIDGQWRISDVPDDFGRWITTSDLGKLLKPYSLHYVATDRRALVPDRRWFPRDHLATRLARAQLAAPPAFLAGAARNDIPSGARLTADSVPVKDGVAQVEITGQVPTDQVQRENVYAQLVATLIQDPAIQGVVVQVRDVVLELPNVDLPVRTVDQVNFPALPATQLGPSLVRRGATLFVLPSLTVADREPTPSGLVDVQREFTSLALSASGDEVAAVDPDGNGLSRFRGVTRYEAPFLGTKVGHPAYDTRGFLWAGGIGIDDQAGVRLWAMRIAADPATERQEVVPVTAMWLANRRVVEAKPSPDGDRIAVLHTAEDGSAPQLDVSGVVRGDSGEPRSLTAPLRLGTHLTQLSGLVWLSDVAVATIARRVGATDPPRPQVISLDGQEQQLAEAPQGVAISSAGGERDLLVTTSTGQVLSRAGQQWRSLGQGTDVLVPAR